MDFDTEHGGRDGDVDDDNGSRQGGALERCCLNTCVGVVSCLIWACVPVYDMCCMVQEWCCDVEAQASRADRGSVPRRHRTRRPRVWRSGSAGDPLLGGDREPNHAFHALPTQGSDPEDVDDGLDTLVDDMFEKFGGGGGGSSQLGTQMETLREDGPPEDGF